MTTKKFKTRNQLRISANVFITAVRYGALIAITGTGCGNAAPHPIATEQTASPADGSGVWVLQSAPLPDACNSRLPWGKQVWRGAVVEPVFAQPGTSSRELEAASLIPGCQGLPSVVAVCDCLTASSANWAVEVGLSERTTCDAQQPGGAFGQVVAVESIVDEDSALAPGYALVLVAGSGSSWSALSVLEVASDTDLDETPQLVHATAVVDYQERTMGSGLVFWAYTLNEFSETSTGVWDVSGDSGLTICTVPSATSAIPSCKARIPLASWVFSSDLVEPEPGASRCVVQTENLLSATLEATGDLTLTLSNGEDEAGRAGVYRAWK